MADICPKIYDRILPGDLAPDHIRCTYIAGHEARCSWETLRVIDDLEREEIDVQRADAPLDVLKVVNTIEAGDWDRYLELILSAGHDRKRVRRGTYGFPRRTA